MNRNITVFCSASADLSSKYTKLAEKVGELLARSKANLVYGGDKCGLMGVIAITMKKNSKVVIGVCIDKMFREGRFYERCDDIILTENLAERKQKMIELSDTIIVMPGGIGTINEFLEVIVLIHLKQIKRKVIVVNYENFFDELFLFIENLIRKGFVSQEINNSFYVVKEVDEVQLYL